MALIFNLKLINM